MTNEIEEQSIVFSKEYKEIEAKILKMADDLHHDINREDGYEQQGMKSHAYEIAKDKIKEILKKVRKEKTDQFKPKPSFE